MVEKGDIAQFFPDEPLTVQAIYAYWKRKGDSEPPREYLGMSEIGKECDRYLWYNFRHCCGEDFEGRMYRLFDTGDKEEARFAEDLQGIGCEVHTEQENGEQFGFSDLGGHFRGHMDGCVLNLPEAPKTWHVVEMKTHSDKSFKNLKAKGVKEAKPEHYYQMQCYMKYSSMTRALYIAVNKNTDELYTERIRYNAADANIRRDRAEYIIQSPTPPAGICKDADDWRCRWCPAKALCFGTTPPQAAVPVPKLSCRQCVHATPEFDSESGRWSCAKYQKTINFHAQQLACDSHLFIPALITFATQEDSGLDGNADSWISYRNKSDNALWANGKGADAYSSKELTILPGPMVGANCVDLVKQGIDGKVISVRPPLPARYEDAEIIWTGDYLLVEKFWQEYYRERLSVISPTEVYETDEYVAAEFSGDRLVLYPKTAAVKAEIRKGKQ